MNQEKNSRPTSPPALASGLLIGLVIGYALGWFTTHPGQLENPHSRAPHAAERTAEAGKAERRTEMEAPDLRPDAPGLVPKPHPLTAEELRAALQSMENNPSSGSRGMRDFAGLAQRLKVSDIPKLLDEWIREARTSPVPGGFFFVAAIFAEENPEAAWEYGMKLSPGPIREQLLAASAQALATRDPNAALALADSLADPSLKSRLRNAALMQLASKNPRQAARLAGKGEYDRAFPLAIIHSKWAQSEPMAAWSEALSLDGEPARQAQIAVISALAQRDPRKAWELVSKLPNPAPDLTENLVRIWSESDPASALRAVEGMGPGTGRARILGAAVQSWSRNDPRAATGYVAGIADPILRSDLFQQLSIGQVSDPEFLLSAMLENMPPGSNFQQATSNLLRSWAQRDPKAAAEAIRRLPPGKMLSSAASQLAAIWSSQGKAAEALAWAKSLPQGHTRVTAVESILREVAGKNPQEALQMAKGLPEAENREALREIGRTWSRKNPQEALQWANQLADASLRNEVVCSAITQWAQESPVEAAAYAAKLPEAERARALQGAIERWAARDAESAAQWLQRLPDAPSKDGAQAALARQIAAEDPETALAWATQLHDQDFRQRTIEHIAREWMRQEPEAARAWIARSQLPEEIRSKLLK